MTQRHTAQAIGTRSLIWLLLFAIALMGLTVARQQALGSLHLHADQGLRDSSIVGPAVFSLASEWKNRWRQQQVFGHGQLRPHAALNATPWPLGNTSRARHSAEPHSHNDLERHHHASGDASVLALDGAAGSAEDGATGAVVMLLMLGATCGALVLPALAARQDRWPVDGAVSFISWNVAPLLRPPAV
jgi:hypothetical protein